MRKRLLYLALMVMGCVGAALAQSHTLPYYNPCDDRATVASTNSGAANGSRGWTVQSQGVDKFLRTYNWNSSTALNAAVFFGPFDLEAGKAYCLRANMRKNYNNDPKYDGSVKFAYVPAGTVNVNTHTYNSVPGNSANIVKDENVFYTIDNLNNIEYVEYPVFFSPTENKQGVWIAVSFYFGVVGSQYLYITDFSLEESNFSVPDAPTGCKVTADVEGYKKADFEFTAPTKTAYGNDIASISSVDVYWADFLLHSEKNPTPGQTYKFSHEFAMSGTYPFSFVATYNGAQGPKTMVTETIGVIPPTHTFTSDYNTGLGKQHILLANYIPSLGGVQLKLDPREKANYDVEGMAWKIVRQPGNVLIAEASDTPDIVDKTFNAESKLICYYEMTTVIPEGVSKVNKTYNSTVVSLNNPVPYQVRFNDVNSINEFCSFALPCASAATATDSWTSNSNGYANAYNRNIMLTTPSVVLEGGKYYSFEAGICSNSITPVGFEIYYGGANVPDSMIHQIMPYTMETARQVRVGHKAFFSPERTGNYSFGVNSVNWDNLSNYNSMQLFDINVQEVNADLPGPVEGLKVTYLSGTQAKLTFKASPKNIAGQDQQSLDSIVVYKDGVAFKNIAAPTPGQECAVEVEVVKGTTNIYRVAPFNAHGEGRSESAQVSLIVVDRNTEYMNNFATDIAFDGYTIVDGSNDGYTWSRQFDEARAYPGNTMDEWLITPPVLLNAEQYHKIEFTTHLPSTKAGDRQTYISLWIGNSPEPDSMKQVIVEPYNVTNGEPLAIKTYFDVDTTGTYYIGFHAECQGKGEELYMTGFKIGKDMIPTVAAAPGIKVINDPQGKLVPKVHIDLPEKCINGTDLTSLTYLYLYVDAETSARFSQSLRLDQFSSFDFKLPGNVLSEGVHTFRAYCQNSQGQGQEVEVDAFIGINHPSHPINCWAEQTDNDGEVLITWDAPEVDKDGFEIYPNLVWYNVFEYAYNASTDKYVEIPLADSIRETSFTYQAMQPNSGQAFRRFGVRAHTKTAADRQMSAGVVITPTLLGTAYSMPYFESFSGDEHVHMSQRIGDVTTAMWGMGRQAPDGSWGADGDHGLAVMESLGAYCAAGLLTGRINVSAEQPWMYLYVYNMGNTSRPDLNEIELQVLAPGQPWTPVANNAIDTWTDGYNGWQKITFDLRAYAGKTVQLAIVGGTVNYAYIYIDRMYFGEAPAADMSVSAIGVPAEVFPGKVNTVTADLKNNGLTAATGVVNLYRQGEIVGTSEFAVEPGQRAVVAVADSIALDDAKMVDEFDYKVVLVADGDIDPVDNSSFVGTALVPDWTAYPTVLNLTATSNEKENITLAWEAPAVPAEATAYTFDMEGYEPWISSAKIGPMINIDLDDEACAAINHPEWPMQEYGHYGWFVADMTHPSLTFWGENGHPEYFTAHSGDKVLMAIDPHYSAEYQANDLLVLPRLSGKAQTISFWGKSISDDLRCAFEVGVSYTGNAYSDFQSLEDHGWWAPGEWHEFTFEIPEGVQYAAIRHYGYTGLLLMIDDITYTPAGLEQLEVEGYKVERGTELLANAWAQPSYVDPLDADGNYVYQVSVVYNRGISAAVEASADFTGLEGLGAGQPAAYGQRGEIVIANAAGLAVKAYNAAGVAIYAAQGAESMTVAAPAGVYVVTIGPDTFKVTVK